MTLVIDPIDPGPFNEVEPSSDEAFMAWGTSFLIRDLICGVRVEAVHLEELGLEGFYDEQGLAVPDSRVGYLVKFDNSYNDMDEERAFGRLPAEQRLNQRQIRLFQRYLAGSVIRYLNDFDPHTLIGVPNDAKLELWYERLSRRSTLPTHAVEVRGTVYHTHRVMLVCRR